MRRGILLDGQVFHNWTVLHRIPHQDRWSTWKCQCTCGHTKTMTSNHLKKLGQKVCEVCTPYTPPKPPGNKSHGMSTKPEYHAWANMWARCTNPDFEHYERYKDRCPPEIWRDFEVFFKDMGLRPSPNHTLERVDNDKPYGPENCKWDTWDNQARNRKNNVWLEVDGKKITQSELARLVGTSPAQIFYLLKTKTVEEILVKYGKTKNQ